MKQVSVYIPSYNGARCLSECIEAVLRQAYPVDEIIVVDDGSTDKTKEIASKFQVKLIRHEYNRGIAAARNSAILKAKNDFIASVDADCLLEPNWLFECMKNFDNPNVAAVGGKLIGKNSEGLADRWREVHLKHHWGDKRRINPIFLSGSNLVIRKEILKQIGFYNEKRFKKNYEDVDMSLRLKDKGYNLIYESNAIANHVKKDTLGSILKTYWNWQFHDYKHKYILRAIFSLINSIKLLIEDIFNGKLEFILIDILTFPHSVYLDFKNFLKVA